MRKIAMVNILVLLSLLLGACATSSTPATPQVIRETVVVKETQEVKVETTKIVEQEKIVTTTPLPPAKFNEAPMLADKVKAGELPPLEERMPENPKVISPLVEQGVYGGELRYGFVCGGCPAWGGMLYVAGWEHLVSWKPDYSGFEPNVAESYEINADATEYTFHLRKGMKWSDGEPFTADDIMFYIDDVLKDPDLFPSGPGADWLPADYVEGFTASKVDDYTFKLSFDKPYGTLLYQMAAWGGRQFVMYPKHYLQQFHLKYNPDVDKLVAEDATIKDWMGLFFKKAPANWGDPARYFDDPAMPSLYSFIVTQPLGTGTTLIMVRNPYYWKVDDQGNQLPYIDTINATNYQDDQSRVFAMLNGDLDFSKDPGEPSRELFYQARDEGKPINIMKPQPDLGNMQSIHFNFTDKDPVKAEVNGNKDFRIGMSYAINREEIIEVVFKGQGKPAQVCPNEQSPLWNEKCANQYIEYDVAKAQEYLDKAFPNGKDSEGYYLDKNGKRFSEVLTVLNDSSEGPHWVQVAEMLIAYWKEVGVDIKLDAVTDQVWTERRSSNDVDAFLYHGGEGGSGMSAIIDPRWHVPGNFWGIYGMAWYLQSTDEAHEFGQEMPAYAQEVVDLYEEAIQQSSYDAQVEAMKKVIEASTENFWVIGITRPGPGYQPISTRLGNIPETWLHGWVEGFTRIILPEQWFIKR
ncbi:MAG: ABC transporter substrate-binding protein [Chloroflexota bacterium]